MSPHTHTSDNVWQTPSRICVWLECDVLRSHVCVSHHTSVLEVVYMVYLVYMCLWGVVCLSFNYNSQCVPAISCV